MPRARGRRMSRKNPTRCVGSSSVALTSSFRRRTVTVAQPAARRLRTHWTSPQGAQTQRLPETSMIATGVVRGRPLFRPRMVMSPLGPNGRPVARRSLEIGLRSEKTHRGGMLGSTPGRPAMLPIRSLMCVAPSCVDSFECYTLDPQEGADVTARAVILFGLGPHQLAGASAGAGKRYIGDLLR